MRTLASIQRIVSVSPIEGAKDIERVQVLGWQLVSKKNEFKPDDLCVYIEIDSLLPKDNPAWAFMSKYNFRVKTAKKMGQISQGLALPLSLFPEISPFVQEGKDLTEFLKIEKYEKEEVEEASVSKSPKWYKPFMKYAWFRSIVLPLISRKKSGFPTHLIAKSDETRIQAMPHILTTYRPIWFTETEKVEGCLHEDTKILTENGELSIQDICNNKERIRVLSFNETTGEIELKRIDGFSVLENNGDWYELETESGEKVKLTGEHRVYLPELRCYRRVDSLKGDEFVLLKK